MASSNKKSACRIEDNVLKGEEVDYPTDYEGLGKFVMSTLKKHPHLVGEIDAVTEEEYTYEKMRERSVRCALWMRSQGLLPGDVVALCSGDNLDFAMPCFASLYVGAVFNFWDILWNEEELVHKINVVKPRMIFVHGEAAAKVDEAARKARHDLKIIVFGYVPGFLEFDKIITEPVTHEVDQFECKTTESLDDIAAIIFTSGSTGPPKGVALSHHAVMTLTRQAERIGMPGNVCLVFASSHSITAIESIFMTLLLYMPRVILPVVKEAGACALIEKHKATWISTTPWAIDRIVKLDSVTNYNLSSVRTIIHSGTPLSPRSYKAMSKLLPNAHLFSGYGSTETCAYVSIQSVNSKPESCGEIMENIQLKVVCLDTGRTLGANEKGEIWTKTDFAMSYYWNNPKATAELIDEEGWVHMGDLGYYDERGEIFMIDRLQDVIRTEYYDMCPSEIENVILTHPLVQEVAVVGQPRDQENDRPTAFVVCRTEDSTGENGQVTATEIVNLVAANLPQSRHLSGGVHFLDQLPRTPSNKIRRIALRALAKSIP